MSGTHLYITTQGRSLSATNIIPPQTVKSKRFSPYGIIHRIPHSIGSHWHNSDSTRYRPITALRVSDPTGFRPITALKEFIIKNH